MSIELFSAAQLGLIGWVKTNIGVLLEVTDSLWLIIKTNLNILTSFIGTLLSLFLGGGQAVITFLVNSVFNLFKKKICSFNHRKFCVYVFVLVNFLNGIILPTE